MQVKAIGRRWLDFSRERDGNYRMDYMLVERRIATLIFPPKEFDKIIAFYKASKTK